MSSVQLPALSFGFFEGKRLEEPLYREEIDGYQGAMWRPLPTCVDTRITSDLAHGIIRSWKEQVGPKSDLAYVQVTHVNMDGQPTIGELVLQKGLAQEVVRIVRTIFLARFQIAQMRLIDYWDADDDRSMADNNSSALCVRQITGGGKPSLHSFGRAIDINPLFNPYVKCTPEAIVIAPKEAAEYVDRSELHPGMIRDGDVVVEAFIHNGWEWGGRWKSPRPTDNQHFQRS